MADAARNRLADEYVQKVVLFRSQCGMTAEASLAIAWKNLDPENQRDVSRPTNSIDEFSQDSDKAVEYWLMRKSHDKSSAQDSGYSSPNTIEAVYQRGLRAGERRASSQQQYRPYSNQQQQQQQRPQQYLPQGTYQGPRDRDRDRDRFRPDTQHADNTDAYHGDEYYGDEEDGGGPELPPQSEVFFIDSAWERRDNDGMTPPFACKKCVRRFRDSDDLRDHTFSMHFTLIQGLPLTHITSIYPPTAKSFADMIYVKYIRIILGMDTRRANHINVLMPGDVLKLKDKVPLRNVKTPAPLTPAPEQGSHVQVMHSLS
ncbi:MAG: hypothetical protein OHK93_005008 [Ramalina farinacea]|uniref:C2H2-type domain-containing protein n=1 Tax=Ramalina farinacea TaxID=258253 RepID=A0AA43QZP5_9LECA|nr:hypothetical protein [Ramalina farinacea]